VAAKSLLLIDAAVVQNAVASASVASSHAPFFAHAPVSALSGFDVGAAGLKIKLHNLGLSLIDNTHSQFPVAVSSLSSLSSKAPITDQAPVAYPFNVNEVPLELKATELLPSVEKKLRVFEAALATLRKSE
jgi:hypothetical protein